MTYYFLLLELLSLSVHRLLFHRINNYDYQPDKIYLNYYSFKSINLIIFISILNYRQRTYRQRIYLSDSGSISYCKNLVFAFFVFLLLFVRLLWIDRIENFQQRTPVDFPKFDVKIRIQFICNQVGMG